jgi:LacI family transcriptional regulator
VQTVQPDDPRPTGSPGAAARRATLRTIAERAGVHVSTVSRVLNGTETEGARAAGAATTARIREIATELQYSPDPNATSLRTQRTHLLGVLVPRLSDIVLATIYEGVEETAAGYGYYTFVANTRDDAAEQRARTELMLSRRVDGLICGDAYFDGAYVDSLAQRRIPFVLVSRRAGNHPSVTCDDYLGGRMVAEHLLSLGHERVGVIAGEPYASTGLDRTAGFLDYYREQGVRLPKSRVLNSRFDTIGGHTAGRRLLAARTPPTAIFAVNDFAAIGAMGAAREKGLRVGCDLSIVGFNDVPLARDLPVPLTTVRSPMHEMGERSVHLLMRILSGEAVEAERLPPTLQPRESTQPVS